MRVLTWCYKLTVDVKYSVFCMQTGDEQGYVPHATILQTFLQQFCNHFATILQPFCKKIWNNFAIILQTFCNHFTNILQCNHYATILMSQIFGNIFAYRELAKLFPNICKEIRPIQNLRLQLGSSQQIFELF